MKNHLKSSIGAFAFVALASSALLVSCGSGTAKNPASNVDFLPIQLNFEGTISDSANSYITQCTATAGCIDGTASSIATSSAEVVSSSSGTIIPTSSSTVVVLPSSSSTGIGISSSAIIILPSSSSVKPVVSSSSVTPVVSSSSVVKSSSSVTPVVSSSSAIVVSSSSAIVVASSSSVAAVVDTAAAGVAASLVITASNSSNKVVILAGDHAISITGAFSDANKLTGTLACNLSGPGVTITLAIGTFTYSKANDYYIGIGDVPKGSGTMTVTGGTATCAMGW